MQHGISRLMWIAAVAALLASPIVVMLLVPVAIGAGLHVADLHRFNSSIPEQRYIGRKLEQLQYFCCHCRSFYGSCNISKQRNNQHCVYSEQWLRFSCQQCTTVNCKSKCNRGNSEWLFTDLYRCNRTVFQHWNNRRRMEQFQYFHCNCKFFNR